MSENRRTVRSRFPAARLASRGAMPCALLVGAVAVWQITVQARGVPDWLLPSPQSIWQAGLDEHDLLIANTIPTVRVAVLGFLLAVLLGVLSAVAIRYSRLLELSLYPILIASQSVPLIGLAPILVILLGFGTAPKLVMVCLICFFPITVNVVDGFKSVDPDFVRLMRTLGAGRLRILRDVEVPSVLPFLFSGAKIAVTYSVVGALVAEWMGSWEGLGYLMTQKQAQFDTRMVFAAMVVLTILGVSLFLLVSILERLCLPWRRADTPNK